MEIHKSIYKRPRPCMGQVRQQTEQKKQRTKTFNKWINMLHYCVRILYATSLSKKERSSRVTLYDLTWSYRLPLLKDHVPIGKDDKYRVSEFSDKKLQIYASFRLEAFLQCKNKPKFLMLQ